MMKWYGYLDMVTKTVARFHLLLNLLGQLLQRLLDPDFNQKVTTYDILVE